MTGSWKVIWIALVSVMISTGLNSLLNHSNDDKTSELLFYLQYPGLFCSLVSFGAHGGGGHWFDLVTIAVNTAVYWLVAVSLLWLIIWRKKGNYESRV